MKNLIRVLRNRITLICPIFFLVAISIYFLNSSFNNNNANAFDEIKFQSEKLIDTSWIPPSHSSWQNFTNFDDYKSFCFNLYKKLRFPNEKLFFNPALKRPPADMLDEFTQHGKMPIKKWWYINEVYVDSKGDEKKNKRVFTKDEIEGLLFLVRSNQPLGYDDKVYKF